jgi:hypothetical protein
LRDGLLVDLGEGKQGALLSGNFRICNIGSKELTFTLSAGCACAHLEPRNGKVQSGESLSVNVGLRLRNEGKEERVIIRIESNDMNAESLSLWVVGKCPAHILAEPGFLDFGPVPRARSISKEIRVQFPKLTKPPLAANLVAESTATFISTHVRQHNSSELAIDVSLDSSLPIGHHSGTITIKYEGIERELDIPVVVEVAGLIQVAPASIRFPSISATDKQEQEVILLVRRTDRAALGPPTRLEVPSGLRVIQIPRTDRSDRSTFRVRREPGEPMSEGQEIRMRFDGVEDEIRVPVTAAQN